MDCISVAPILHARDVQIDFGCGLSVAETPDWLWEKDLSATISRMKRSALEQHAAASFVRTYDCTKAIGQNERESIRLIENATCALWLTQYVPPLWDHLWHFGYLDGEWKTRSFSRYGLVEWTDECNKIMDLNDGKQLTIDVFRAIGDLEERSTLFTACRILRRAMAEHYSAIRYLLYWIILEALYGPEDGREIMFRMCQRIALFLGCMNELKTWDHKPIEAYASARTLFDSAKNAYGIRSKIVHGLRFKKKAKDTEPFHCSEDLVRVSLLRILGNADYIHVFNSKNRGSFLDSFVLG